jgi:hypothetical protein
MKPIEAQTGQIRMTQEPARAMAWFWTTGMTFLGTLFGPCPESGSPLNASHLHHSGRLEGAFRCDRPPDPARRQPDPLALRAAGREGPGTNRSRSAPVFPLWTPRCVCQFRHLFQFIHDRCGTARQQSRQKPAGPIAGHQAKSSISSARYGSRPVLWQALSRRNQRETHNRPFTLGVCGLHPISGLTCAPESSTLIPYSESSESSHGSEGFFVSTR